MFTSGLPASTAPADSRLVPTASSTLPRPVPAAPPPQQVRAPRSLLPLVLTPGEIPAESRVSTPLVLGQPLLQASPQRLTPWVTFPAFPIWPFSMEGFTPWRVAPDALTD